MTETTRDQDQSKGATEDDGHGQPSNASLQGQLGHRDQNSLIKDADSDFPEPGLSPEHSGEPEVNRRTIPAKKDIRKTA
jgi:hypothetical protein